MDEKKEWESGIVAKALEKSPERCSEFLTTSGIPVERLYTPEDISGQYTEQLGYPGQYPFTRGIQPTMYRGRFWTMRQYAGFATAEESNRRYRYLLEQGQTGISIAFDLPTQIGYDSDDPMAHGEVGKVGVAIDSLADMEVLFREIPLDKISTSMTINAPAAVLLAFYIAAAEKQGVPASALKGTIQNDILKEYSARGTYIFPPAPSMRLITNTFAFCAQNVPKWNTISISGYHIREAGSTAAQEIAFTLADGIAYVEAALDAGMDVDDFAGRLSFFFNAHNDLLEEVAKYRAARRLWAKIMKERFHAKKDRSMMLRFHTQTGGSIGLRRRKGGGQAARPGQADRPGAHRDAAGSGHLYRGGPVCSAPLRCLWHGRQGHPGGWGGHRLWPRRRQDGFCLRPGFHRPGRLPGGDACGQNLQDHGYGTAGRMPRGGPVRLRRSPYPGGRGRPVRLRPDFLPQRPRLRAHPPDLRYHGSLRRGRGVLPRIDRLCDHGGEGEPDVHHRPLGYRGYHWRGDHSGGAGGRGNPHHCVRGPSGCRQ